MFVTMHAFERMVARLGLFTTRALERVLESYNGERGTVAYLAYNMPAPAVADDGSNGEVVVVIAVEGSVETVYFRRADQDLSAEFFGASRVVDLRTRALYE
jgi:hypothetical protein